MSKKENYYIVTAQVGGDMDLFYYVFNNKTYFELFLQIIEYENNNDKKSVFNLIDNAQ